MPDLWIVLSITMVGWFAVIPAFVFLGSLKLSWTRALVSAEGEDRTRPALCSGQRAERQWQPVRGSARDEAR